VKSRYHKLLFVLGVSSTVGAIVCGLNEMYLPSGVLVIAGNALSLSAVILKWKYILAQMTERKVTIEE